ncbi:hypothetical protein [Xanthomonas graminis]|uniref:hypothetical protein n=1 Tax=Xanthomonas graminis TaxID=3390026 RepID=UPI001F2D8811|nr:hypothetical protein [Xanthomonas translucens]UKE74909.1 hypothetical protein KFS85_08515 [Xanthomonas translucens pv. phleipratensis]
MVTAGAAQAQSCRLQTHTLPLPLVSQHMPEHAYQVRVQVGTPPASANSAAAIQVLEVDTGSTGVVVPLSAAIQHAWDASSKLGYIFYSSNSQYHPGKYVQVPMRLGVSADGKSAVASIDSIGVLAAQCSCGVAPIPKATLPGSVQTLSQAPDNCAAYNDTLALSSGGKQMLKKCTTIPSTFGMMGVGYDRGVDAARNPFLNLVQMQAGSISSGLHRQRIRHHAGRQRSGAARLLADPAATRRGERGRRRRLAGAERVRPFSGQRQRLPDLRQAAAGYRHHLHDADPDQTTAGAGEIAADAHHARKARKHSVRADLRHQRDHLAGGAGRDADDARHRRNRASGIQLRLQGRRRHAGDTGRRAMANSAQRAARAYQ